MQQVEQMKMCVCGGGLVPLTRCGRRCRALILDRGFLRLFGFQITTIGPRQAKHMKKQIGLLNAAALQGTLRPETEVRFTAQLQHSHRSASQADPLRYLGVHPQISKPPFSTGLGQAVCDG